ncbi:MAG: hypothetical protein M3Q95_05585 [Bacteroidota bacterium]|nr:hypothetical protein [Bacteroidota bacterium]
MNRFKVLFLLLLAGLYSPLVLAEEIPVLLMLRSSEQHDTSGCNFVEQVTALVYKEITENRVKLWDSPQKEIQITGSTLKEIERNAGVSFLAQETIFMYEIWNNNRKEIVTKTLGFSFVHRSSSEDEVTFGYVDYNELTELFLKTRINTNASGIYSATYTTYVLSKNFAFNIVQFAGKVVKSTGESDDLKKAFLRNLPFNQSLLGYYPPDKFVSYIIDTYTEGTDEKSLNSKAFIKTIEDYFYNNQEVFFNMGGDMITSHLQKNKIKVTKIEVTEIWRKVNGELNFEPKTMKIFINDSALSELNPRTMVDFEINFQDKSVIDFLKEKQFNLIITKVNSQVIKRKDSYLYYKGLMTAEWNRVIDYVVNNY